MKTGDADVQAFDFEGPQNGAACPNSGKGVVIDHVGQVKVLEREFKGYPQLAAFANSYHQTNTY